MPQFQRPFQRPQEPNTGYPQWQQPPQPWYPPLSQVYAPSPQPLPSYQQLPPIPQPPKKKSRKLLWIFTAAIVLVISLIGTASQGKGNTPTSTRQATQAPRQLQSQPTQAPTPTPTLAPTPTPTLTLSPGVLERTFISTTVANLDKEGNNDQGKDVHFITTILSFVKDKNGYTVGANLCDPDSSSVIQVEFPTGTDVSQLNEDDTLEVWGTDEGTSTGPKTFGAMMQEVDILVLYMTDQTTGYKTG